MPSQLERSGPTPKETADSLSMSFLFGGLRTRSWTAVLGYACGGFGVDGPGLWESPGFREPQGFPERCGLLSRLLCPRWSVIGRLRLAGSHLGFTGTV